MSTRSSSHHSHSNSQGTIRSQGQGNPEARDAMENKDLFDIGGVNERDDAMNGNTNENANGTGNVDANKSNTSSTTASPHYDTDHKNGGAQQEAAPSNADASDGDAALKDLELSLQSCDWETLQHKFTEAMEERTQHEIALQRDTADLLDVSDRSQGDFVSVVGRRC
ncbi:hypothetical protein KEM55_008497 [Ascosphaera atra]|nr:hypothetical protein KEM55_008497 [Ascosphaera atra]